MNAVVTAICITIFIVGEVLCEKRINKLENIIKKQRKQLNPAVKAELDRQKIENEEQNACNRNLQREIMRMYGKIDELRAENARLLKYGEWKDAIAELPDDDEGDVLVWYQCKCCGTTSQSWGITFVSRGDWHTKHLDGEDIQVLFWHSLPKPPVSDINAKKDGGVDK